MKTLNGAIALLLLAGFFLAVAVSIFVPAADARADFVTWADRLTRPGAPCGCTENGTCVQRIVAWPGVKGVGNVGIGDGNVSLMQPEFINDAMKSFNEGLTKNESAPGNTTGEVIAAPLNNSRYNGTLVTGNATAASETAEPGGEEAGNVTSEPEESETLTESLLPGHVMSAGTITRTEPYSIVYGDPFPHILNEDQVEAGVIYGKMFGLPLPGGRTIDIGIKSLGSEY
jgi:hypothetical protein